MKICVCCKQEKPETEFNKDRSKQDGLNTACRDCRRTIYKKSDAKPKVREKRLTRQREWMANNKEKGRIASSKWRGGHHEAHVIYLKEWRAKNRQKVNAEKRERYMRMKSITPAWANKEEIKKAYHYATLMTKISGMLWEVDHQVPINSPNVTGFHCEANLAIIPNIENQRKGNRWWPDMW